MHGVACATSRKGAQVTQGKRWLAAAFGLTTLLGCAEAVVRPNLPSETGRTGLLDRITGSTGSRSAAFSRDESFSVLPQSEGEALRWPLAKIKVTSEFGRRGRDFHEGVDLRARSGTPVLAAQSGVVLYAGGGIRGYGRLVVIRHAHGLATVYAHNSRLLVKRGQKIRQGQRVALSGATGRCRGPHLHFEVRRDVVALNPLELMPSPRVITGSVEIDELPPTSTRVGS
jgi:murein DD-endopeptidase MepM/ murein hydrolase activator NlpD